MKNTRKKKQKKNNSIPYSRQLPLPVPLGYARDGRLHSVTLDYLQFPDYLHIYLRGYHAFSSTLLFSILSSISIAA